MPALLVSLQAQHVPADRFYAAELSKRVRNFLDNSVPVMLAIYVQAIIPTTPAPNQTLLVAKNR